MDTLAQSFEPAFAALAERAPRLLAAATVLTAVSVVDGTTVLLTTMTL